MYFSAENNISGDAHCNHLFCLQKYLRKRISWDARCNHLLRLYMYLSKSISRDAQRSYLFCLHKCLTKTFLAKLYPLMRDVTIYFVCICIWPKVYPEMRNASICFVCVWVKIYPKMCNVKIYPEMCNITICFFLHLCLRKNISWDAHYNKSISRDAQRNICFVCVRPKCHRTSCDRAWACACALPQLRKSTVRRLVLGQLGGAWQQ